MGSICGRSHGFAELHHDPEGQQKNGRCQRVSLPKTNSNQPPLKMWVSNRNSADGHTVDKKRNPATPTEMHEIFSRMGLNYSQLVVEPTHLENMRKSNWIISCPQFSG